MINSVYINIPAVSGATSGTHSLYIAASTTNAGYMVEVTSPYNQSISIQGLSVRSGTPIPVDTSAIATCLSNVMFDHDLTLYFKYINNTNHAQTAARVYNTMYVIQYEGSL